MNRRGVLEVLAAAAASGLPLDASAASNEALYRFPRCGDVTILHITDTHAQLLPHYYREPSINVGVGSAADRPPHLVGEQLFKAYGITAESMEAYAFTPLNFENAARKYGKVGGFAHLATLVKLMRADRP